MNKLQRKIDHLTLDLQAFIVAYLNCALWSTHDEENDEHEMLDEAYVPDDFTSEAMDDAIFECGRFCTLFEEEIGGHHEQAGHDFWLTRNGHGAGFWDRGDVYGQEAADKMSENVGWRTQFGELDIYQMGDELEFSERPYNPRALHYPPAHLGPNSTADTDTLCNQRAACVPQTLTTTDVQEVTCPSCIHGLGFWGIDEELTARRIAGQLADLGYEGVDADPEVSLTEFDYLRHPETGDTWIKAPQKNLYERVTITMKEVFAEMDFDRVKALSDVDPHKWGEYHWTIQVYDYLVLGHSQLYPISGRDAADAVTDMHIHRDED